MREFLLSNLKLNNIQRSLFYLLILFFPTQFGRHFWPDISFIKGIRVDYLSPTLYFTDLLIFSLFVLWCFSKSRFSIYHLASSIYFSRKMLNGKLVIGWLVFILIGVISSKSPMAGVYGFTKLLEFVFLGFYVAWNMSKLKLKKILLMFAIGIIFESSLTVSQNLSHGSLNGIFYFFGERAFNSQTPGIANASLKGELVLRPYATFPHPNVLAGYLVIAMMLILSRIKNYESRIKRIMFIVTLAIGTTALVLTLSRVAVLLWLIIVIFYFIRKFMIHNPYFIILFLIGILLLGLTTPFGARFIELKLTDEAIAHRASLIASSIAMIQDHPILGVGLNNFLVNLPFYQIDSTPLFYLQPVHNIFLLILAETGLVGLILFVWLIFSTYKKIMNHESRIKNMSIIHNSYFLILSSVLILGMFDHYFLTLQQGQLLFSFILGLCWSKKLLQ